MEAAGVAAGWFGFAVCRVAPGWLPAGGPTVSYATGAAWCLRRGLCVTRAGRCIYCGERPPLFDAVEVDRYEAADANRDYVRAEAEAHDSCSDGERDAMRGRPE